MKWFVSRQRYWGVDPEDENCVEIAAGGLDYANPDMLVEKYEGEGKEYTDPREAVAAALVIRDSWQKDQPKLIINVEHGCTAGFTMPFIGDHEPGQDEILKAWAEKAYEDLPKCDECGEPLPEHPLVFPDDPDFKFCTEYCAERWQEKQEEANELVEEEE